MVIEFHDVRFQLGEKVKLSIHFKHGYHLKYWTPIQYDTIEDGKNKTSHSLNISEFQFIWLDHI